jgi:hypothetical protein
LSLKEQFGLVRLDATQAEPNCCRCLPTVTPQATQIDNLFHAVSNILLQVNHTNQALLGYLSNSTPTQNRLDPKIKPRSFSGLPTEDILTWIDYFENVAAYHQ